MANIFNQFDDFVKDASSTKDIPVLDLNHVYEVDAEKPPVQKQNISTLNRRKAQIFREKHLDPNYKAFISKSNPNFKYNDNSRRPDQIQRNGATSVYPSNYNQNFHMVPAPKPFLPSIEQPKIISVLPSVINTNSQYSMLQNSNLFHKVQPNKSLYQPIPNAYKPTSNNFQYNSMYPTNSNYQQNFMQTNPNYISQTSPVMYPHLFTSPYQFNYNFNQMNPFLSTSYPMVNQRFKSIPFAYSNPKMLSSNPMMFQSQMNNTSYLNRY